LGFKLTVLGCNSALFSHGRHTTSQWLQAGKFNILIDCGEGTQLQMRKYGLNFNSITHILISHLHGDHVYGLVGLLSSMHLSGRSRDLRIFGPFGLDDIITTQFQYSHTTLNFNLDFFGLGNTVSEKIESNSAFDIYTIPLRHKVYCNGFMIKESEKERPLFKDKLNKNISYEDRRTMKSGKNVYENDEIKYDYEDFTSDPPEPTSYSFCTDTLFTPEICEKINQTDLLYHEATFSEDQKDLAQKTFHSTAREAAEIARRSNSKKLLIGHFSSRYKNLDPLLSEARDIFPNTHLAEEGLSYQIG
jgi:ribonuclease Z